MNARTRITLALLVATTASAQPATPATPGTQALAQPVMPPPSLPSWARPRWVAIAADRGLKRSTHLPHAQLTGDFDGDGKPDVAVIVESIRTHKIGVLFMHHTKIITVYIVGAGTRLGNGGDNFDWVDAWHVERPGNKVGNFDSIVLEKESSASARVMFVHGKYRWKQLGD